MNRGDTAAGPAGTGPGPAAAAGGDAPVELLSLRSGVSVATSGDQRHLVTWPHAENLGALPESRLEVLRRLATGPHHPDELAAVAAGAGEPDEGLPEFLARLRAGGWLRVTVVTGGTPRYTVDPLRPPPPPRELPPGAVLSRFAVLRRDGADLVVECSLAWCDVRLHDPAAVAAVGGLATGGRPGEAADPLAARLVADLAGAGMLAAPGEEDGELRLRQWSPHELWFHDRSRVGYRGPVGDRFGGTSWARGTFDPLPGRHEPFPGPAIDLYRPDLGALRRDDPPLTAVLEERRSYREHDDDHPLTAEQLGELLYRCARTRDSRTAEGVDLVSRPYPAGGALHELELYPLVRHVEGLAPGLYHYDGEEHRLRLVCAPPSLPLRRLLRGAQTSTLLPSEPQVLLVVAARVGRLMWKYEAMAYALTLKHVGVLYQTLYCVATAMGLAPCAVGAGDAPAFAEASGLDPLVECSVGEFVLGSRPAGAGA